MTNLELIMSTDAFKIYIMDKDDKYIDTSSWDRWRLVRDELLEKGYEVESSSFSLMWAWIEDKINELPKIIKVVS